MYRLFAIIILFTFSNLSYSQQKYWLCFKDKDIRNYDFNNNLSKETIKNRVRFGLSLYQLTDVPLKEEYLQALQAKGIHISCRSKWLNAVSAFIPDEQLTEIKGMDFIENVIPIDRKILMAGNLINPTPEFFSIALKQMQAGMFLSDSITGKDISVGIIDAGFENATKDKYLLHVFEHQKVKAQRDFIEPGKTDLVNEALDYHGRVVMDMITGYDPKSKTQVGLAVNANLYLARTENGAREYRGEEDNWVQAMEWMDSLGVRLINTSLGYAIKMDDPKDNYKQEEMNGKTTTITKAAQIAVDEKGIFLVVSAGNEGDNDDWRIISAPADAQGVLSVGATRDKVWDRIGYSSIGPEFLSYMKPNVSCYSPNGTSFSAPAIAGFVACLMQMNPNLKNKELKDVIEKSGHLYPYGNNYLGYGVPLASRAEKLVKDPSYNFNNACEKKVKGKKTTVKFDKLLNSEAVLFHKKNELIVVEQTTSLVKKGKLKMRWKAGVKRTTVSAGGKVFEVIWE
jgi:subtilisin family serine protease